MSRNRKRILILALIAIVVLAAAGTCLYGIPFMDSGKHLAAFDDSSLSGWESDANYKLSVEAGELKVEADKSGNAFAGFSYTFSPHTMKEYPYVSLKLHSDMDFKLNVSVGDTEGKQSSVLVGDACEVVRSPYATVYTFDFSQVRGVNIESINRLIFSFNHESLNCTGTVWLDDLCIAKDAFRAPHFTTIPEQQTYIGTQTQLVPLRGIKSGIANEDPVSFSAKSSNPSLIPDPVVEYKGGTEAVLQYTAKAGKTGKATITVTAAAKGLKGKKSVRFDIQVENNMIPRIDPISDQLVKAGELTEIGMTGLDDGNPNVRQKLQLSAASSDPGLLPDPQIQYASDDRWGSLILAPVKGKKGEAVVTLTIKDDGGTTAGGKDTLQTSFKVAVFEDVNHPPVMDPVGDHSILQDSSGFSIPLTGISDGDPDKEQQVALTASSSDSALLPEIQLVHESGRTTGELKIKPAPGKTGKATITVKLADNGGNDKNNGNAASDFTFDLDVRPAPRTGYEDDFNDGNTDPVWNNKTEDAHICSEKDGALVIEVDKNKTNNKWAGLWFEIPQELDLSQNPYISIRMKTDTPHVGMLIFLWDYKDTYNTAGTVTHTVLKDYQEYYFDFSDKLTSSDGGKVDLSRIKALLINFAPGSMYKGTFYFDDLRVGDKAHREGKTVETTINPVPDFYIGESAGEQTVLLTGISNGSGDGNNVDISVSSSDPGLIPAPAASKVTDGNAALSFKPAAGKTGTAVLTAKASAAGAAPKEISFSVTVVKTDDASAIDISIDPSTRYQTVDGFGAFLGSGKVTKAAQELLLPKVIDIGMSTARFGVIDQEFEPVNDNSNPYVTNYDAFNYDALPLDFMKELKEKSAIDKYIVTMWSPPAWMKKNKSLAADYKAVDNVLIPQYYEEYAEHMVALIKAVREKTGIDLYAVSLQNEPQFNEPYASGILLPEEYGKLLKVIGPRFRQEGIKTRLFLPEALPQQKSIDDYIRIIDQDPEASQYVDIVAIHNYDEDGIRVGGPGAKEWAEMYQWAQASSPKRMWMTETSGHPDSWDGAMTLAGNIYNALNAGNASAWIFWSFNVTPDSSQFGLLINGEETSRYAVSKNFYKYTRPGSVRVASRSSSEDVLSLAFMDEKEKSTTVILINRGREPHVASIKGPGLPTSFEVYTTADNRFFEKQPEIRDGKIVLPSGSVTTLYGK